MESERKSPAVSVIMPVGGTVTDIRESIESILNQSFRDYECLVVDETSAGTVCTAVDPYADERFIRIENTPGTAVSLNLELNRARGKYIALMDATKRMHPDRLKIQYAVMEEEPAITVCGTQLAHTGKTVQAENKIQALTGWVENPLQAFLRGNFLHDATAMIRTSFLTQHLWPYEENNPGLQAFKLWVEIAKRNGEFYVDSQPLVFYHESDVPRTVKGLSHEQETNERIIDGILEYFVTENRTEYPEYTHILAELRKLQQKKIITHREIVSFYHSLLSKSEAVIK